MVPSSFRRFLAYLVDQILMGFFYLPVLMQIFFSLLRDRDLSQITFDIRWWLFGFFCQLMYRVLFLKLLGGTIGKLIFGLRLVPREQSAGPELSWMQVWIRVLADHLALFFSNGLFCLALLRFDRTHPSDWLAETRVIQLKGLVPARKRYPVVAIVLCLYFSLTGFLSVRRVLQQTEWHGSQITLPNLWSRPGEK